MAELSPWTQASNSVRSRLRRLRRPPHRAPVGAPPGTLLAHEDAVDPELRVFAYGPGAFEQHDDIELSEVAQLRGRFDVLWLDIVGLSDTELVRRIGDEFGLHPLALEDVLNVEQRPKLDDYGEHLYAVTRITSAAHGIDTEQISLFIAPGLVITFQERPGDCFDPVRDRLSRGRGRIRGAGSDYLAYALLDAVVDHYFPVVDAYGERLDQLEDQILVRATRKEVMALLDVRHELMALRRIILGLRDTQARLLNADLAVISDDTRVYLRDSHDHAIRLLGDVDGWRDLAASLMEVHRSVVGQQLNEVMKVLTIIATIFIPLSFVTGLYGMNFDPARSPLNMPELGWYYGYPAAVVLMVVMVLGQLIYFRRRGWLGE